MVDSSKIVEKIGKFPLPVEIVRFGYTHTINHFQNVGMNPVLRQKAEIYTLLIMVII